ncbi:MAG: hypothetical protein B7Z10_10220 [Rhodobacterales bacterium 32-66-7]|nr:MAG: hypothetical protein B7Z31_08560 [Rhodobacterales bacterium 12-65-15]OYX23907.1 MAG: hypothetical protein B7Z10_10220 [Rhodobacterales bacterium 32-66-7]
MRRQTFLRCSTRSIFDRGEADKETTMTFIAPNPLRAPVGAEDPLAYFVRLPTPIPALRPMSALDQMYAYYAPVEAAVRRQT